MKDATHKLLLSLDEQFYNNLTVFIRRNGFMSHAEFIRHCIREEMKKPHYEQS